MPSSAAATTYLYTLSLHDALPISLHAGHPRPVRTDRARERVAVLRRVRPRHSLQADSGLGALVSYVLSTTYQDRWLDALLGSSKARSEEHTSELQSHVNLVCRLLLPPPPTSTPFPYTTLFRSHCTPAIPVPSGLIEPENVSQFFDVFDLDIPCKPTPA